MTEIDSMALPWLFHSDKCPLPSRERRGLQLVAAAPGEHRDAVEAFIRARFAAQYDAHIRHFMPRLLALQDADGELQGAVGYRGAEDGALFLERYLDTPIERAILDRCGRAVARGEVVEVGNLATQGPGAARMLIVTVTDLLLTLGYRWVVFTGTTGLLNSFRRLGLSPQLLGPADPARMGEDLADWGSYYASRPHVMAGEIAGGHERLRQLADTARPDCRIASTAPSAPSPHV